MSKISKKVSLIAISSLCFIGFAGLGACGKKEAAAPAASAEVPAAPAAATNEVAATNTAAAPAAPAVAAISDADKAALAKLPAPFKEADLANGKRQFALCKSCHSIAAGAPNMTGPNLHGVVGRKSGSVAGFTYSDAMKSAGKTWDVATINTYLQNPKTFIPNNKMAFAGVPSEANRRDVIAYVAVESAK